MLLAVQVSNGQRANQLLEETAAHYSSLDAYEFVGVMDMQFTGTGWEQVSKIVLFFPRKGSLPSGSPLNGESRSTYAATTVVAGTDPLPEYGIPYVGHFDKIMQSMLNADDLGPDVLEVNHSRIHCEKLKVKYQSTDEHPHPEFVTYWIDPDTHLVYKETYTASIGHHIDNAVFTFTLDSLKFHVPTPQFLVDAAVKLAAKEEVSERKEWIGKIAPDFLLPSLTGAPLQLSTLRGKTVLLDFWAIACGPCRIELPIVESVGVAYRDRKVEVFGISFDEAEKARTWLQKNNHSNQTLIDSDQVVSTQYGVQGIPTLVLIGRDGRVERYWDGPPSKETIEAALEKSLQQQAEY
jgi:peroxiredoxin